MNMDENNEVPKSELKLIITVNELTKIKYYHVVTNAILIIM